jgi:L-malate glycosyltransferase
MKPVRLLWISQLAGEAAGLRAEAAHVLGVQAAGVRVTVLCMPGSRFAGDFRGAGIEVVEKHPVSKWKRGEAGVIRRLVEERGIDTVIAFNSKAIVQSIRALRGMPVRLLTYRGFAGHLAWYDPTSYLTHLHPRVDGIWCLSHAVKRYLDRQLVFREPPTTVIYKGQDPAWFEGVTPLPRRDMGLAIDDFAVVMVANYRKYKGVDDAVRAMAFVPDGVPVRLVLIGRGMNHPELERLIRRLPDSGRVIRLGFRQDVLACAAACDLAVNASWTEALSKTLIEATFLGLPCVATDVSGNPELIPNERYGWLVPVQDPKALAAAFCEAWGDKEEREKRAGMAKKRFEEILHLPGSIAKLVEWLQGGSKGA